MRVYALIAGALGLATAGFAGDFSSPAPAELAKNSADLGMTNHVIDHVDYRGSGCHQGDMDWDVSHDNRYLTFRYFDLGVEASRGQADWHDCNVDVSISLPEGYRVGVQSVGMRGFAVVSDSQSSASIDIATGVDRHRPVTLSQRRQPGYFNEPINFADTLSWRDIQWSPCGRYDSRHTLQFQTYLQVRASSTGQAEMSGSPGTGSMDQTYTLLWERCDGGGTPPPPPPSRYWYGSCRVELETLWGDNVSDFWGPSRATSYNQAVRAARLDGLDRCERARGGNQVTRCVVDENQCSATY